MMLFFHRCKVLDCLAVVEYLREKLHSEETQVVLVRDFTGKYMVCMSIRLHTLYSTCVHSTLLLANLFSTIHLPPCTIITIIENTICDRSSPSF